MRKVRDTVMPQHLEDDLIDVLWMMELGMGLWQIEDKATYTTKDQRRAITFYKFATFQDITYGQLSVICEDASPGQFEWAAKAIAEHFGVTYRDIGHANGRDHYTFYWPEHQTRKQLAGYADWIYTAYPEEIGWVEPSVVIRLASAPNDPAVRLAQNSSWPLLKVSAPVAWEKTRGLEIGTGEPVYVAVFDSGLYMEHEDLSGRFL